MARRLRELRDERVLSTRGLARRAGVAHDTIIQLEAGRRRAHPGTIRKLAAALDVEPSELAYLRAQGGEDSPKVPALLQPQVQAWLRERGAERHLQRDEKYAERIERLGVEQVVEEVGALSGERSDLKAALGKPSRLPEGVRDQRRELRRELSALFLARLIALKNRGEALIAAEVGALGDEEALRRIESFERDVALTLASGAGDEDPKHA